MTIFRTIKREKTKIVAVTVLVLVSLHIISHGATVPFTGKNLLEITMQDIKIDQAPVIDADTLKTIRNYTVFFNDLESVALHSPSLKDSYKGKKAIQNFEIDGKFLFNKNYLNSVLDIPDPTLEELKSSHTEYVDTHINRIIENYGVSTFGNILKSDKEWSEYEGSRGYVMVGGGQYSWLSSLVIKQIRSTGSKLPIELFIATKEEYEEDFCEKFLPSMNARCNVFDDTLAKDLKLKFNIGGFQLKMLALMSSKFENILYLDSDNFPTKNVDYLFDSELYKEKNLILWPDLWTRTTNPKFYDIASVDVEEKKVRYSIYDTKEAKKEGLDGVKPLEEYNFENSNYHDFEGTIPNPTTEAGMLMVNKTSHLRTLLLCLYYNVFGPKFYYPLLTQGGAGEGDKETFLAAAIVMGEPWFQTKKRLQAVGYASKEDGLFRTKALGHYDPVQSMDESRKEIDTIFMHLSYPKFYPLWLDSNHDLIYKDSKDHIRMYGGVYNNIGYDFDLKIFQFFVEGACENYYDWRGQPIDGEKGVTRTVYMGDYLKYIGNDKEVQVKRCAEVFLPHLAWLKNTTRFDRE